MLMPWSWHINITAFVCDALSLVFATLVTQMFSSRVRSQNRFFFSFLSAHRSSHAKSKWKHFLTHTGFKQLSFLYFDNWTRQFMYLQAQNVTLQWCFGVLYMRNCSFRLLREACSPRYGPAHRLSCTPLEWHLWHLTFISTDYLFRPISYILNLWNGPRTYTSMHNKLTVCCSRSPERGGDGRDKDQGQAWKLSFTANCLHAATFIHGTAGLEGHRLAHVMVIESYRVFTCLLIISKKRQLSQESGRASDDQVA